MRRRLLTSSLCSIWTAAVLLTVFPSAAQKKTLSIKGSDTMVNLGQAWAESFMEAHPGSQISVTGGGSGTGIAALLNGTCDIATCSRELSSSEKQRAAQKGRTATQTSCALDGVAIAVNAQNPLKALSVPQIAFVFDGSMSDWSALKGKLGKILVLSRESSSGTYVFFREHVLQNKNYRSDALLMPSTKAIATEISKNPAAIGYGGEAYFKSQAGVKVLPVAAKPGVAPIQPTDANIRSGKYPISRPLYLITPGKPAGMAAEFIRFALSPAGQKTVKEVGYTAIR